MNIIISGVYTFACMSACMKKGIELVNAEVAFISWDFQNFKDADFAFYIKVPLA